MRKMADGFAAIRRAELLRRGDVRRRARRRRCSSNLDWQQLHRRGVRPLPADRRDGRRRRDARHRIPEPLATARVGQTDPRDRARHAGLLEHRRPGVHERIHRPGLRHGDVRRGAARQDRGAQRARADRDGAPRRVRPPVVAGRRRRISSPACCAVCRSAGRRCSTSTRRARSSTACADDWSMRAARLALESRAFPFLTFDPDAGPLFADALSLDGNPSVDQTLAGVRHRLRRRRGRRAAR